MSLFGKSAEPIKRPDSPTPRPTSGAAATPQAAPPALVARPTASGTPCVIGAKTTVKGELLGDEDVQVEGTVEGQIRITRDVRVGPTGVVRANVDAVSVVVSGELVGDCSASNRVEIQASGRLTGNIRAPKIVIAEGAVFRGNSDMSASRPGEKRERG
jgi:cytoskeletal protein CcmA (bactofilin family)